MSKKGRAIALLLVVFIAMITWSALTAFDFIPSLREIFTANAEEMHIIQVTINDGVSIGDRI